MSMMSVAGSLEREYGELSSPGYDWRTCQYHVGVNEKNLAEIRAIILL